MPAAIEEKTETATGEVLAPIRYVVDANGEKTDVVIPMATWQRMLVSWQEVVELKEDKDDSAILQDWLNTTPLALWRRSRWMNSSRSCCPTNRRHTSLLIQ